MLLGDHPKLSYYSMEYTWFGLGIVLGLQQHNIHVGLANGSLHTCPEVVPTSSQICASLTCRSGFFYVRGAQSGLLSLMFAPPSPRSKLTGLSTIHVPLDVLTYA